MKHTPLLVAAILALAIGERSAAATNDELAGQIEARVCHSVNAPAAADRPASVAEFEELAVTASWAEIWPKVGGGEQTRTVEGPIWNTPIQAALAKYGAVFLPKRDAPYYINNPIVLKSGQRLCADRGAEIRLVPGVNTCMVRNEHIVGGHDGPIPAEIEPDTHIVIEGGIWTTLATSGSQCNGNIYGRSAQQADVPGCHGVVVMNNVRGALIRNLTVRQSKAHGIQLSNCHEFLVENIAFEEHRRDGVHAHGPASYGIIRNIRGATEDDFVALNAWDWRNAAPTFGPIDHLLVEGIDCGGGTDEIRLLPGTKTFASGAKLDCPIVDCVFRDLRNIRTVKIYDQPNLELGRDQDFCDPIGTVTNVRFSKLVFNRAGRFQIAANVDGLSIDNVQLNFDINTPENKDFKLVEIGPMSQTATSGASDPSAWVELFSPDRDVTVRSFRLTNVSTKVGDRITPLTDAEARLVKVSDQQPNPDYPKTTPRGGTGKAKMVQ